MPVYKGQYPESMAAAIAAYRAGNAPQIVQVFEVGTATMMSAKGAIKPVYQVMAESGEKFDPKIYISAPSTGTTRTRKGQTAVACRSTARRTVFYINEDAFKKAGLDPNKPPTTWPEVGQAASQAEGIRRLDCAFTTGWQSWVQLESFSAWHNVPFATLENGFGGLDTTHGVQRPAAGQAHRYAAATGRRRATSRMRAARTNRGPSSTAATAR